MDIMNYLANGAAEMSQRLWDDFQKTEEVFIIVAEALTKHQAADHVGDGAAQEEGRIKGACWRTTGKIRKRFPKVTMLLLGFSEGRFSSLPTNHEY